MITHDKIMLLAQLVESMYEAGQGFEEAYKKQDKKRFDSSKVVILDFQNKINSLVKEK